MYNDIREIYADRDRLFNIHTILWDAFDNFNYRRAPINHYGATINQYF